MRKNGVLNERFPALLKAKREARRLSMLELAARIGVTGHKIESWENGSARPSPDKWPSLANALGTTVDELIHGTVRRQREAAPDLATQVGRLVAAFLVCEPDDRQSLLRNAEFRARGRSTPH